RAFHGVAYSHIAQGRVAWCRGDLATAKDELRSAGELDQGHDAALRVNRMVLSAEVLASTGDFQGCDDLLTRVWENGDPAHRSPTFRLWAAGWGIWNAGAHDDLASATQWLRIVEQAGHVAHLPPAVWARTMILQQAPDRVIDRFGVDGRHLPRQPLPFVRTGLMLEKALRQQGSRGDAAEFAATLASFASSRNVIQPLLDEPEAFGNVPVQTLEPAVRTLVEALRRKGGSLARQAADDTLTAGNGDFTARELDVIRYLPTRMTNKAMADQLSVSLNTVKSHLRSIYRKLAASSRTEAIERLRSRGLL
ncbi:MAG: response regulator transcription factor, partial [Acidimicrobiales bacterium]